MPLKMRKVQIKRYPTQRNPPYVELGSVSNVFCYHFLEAVVLRGSEALYRSALVGVRCGLADSPVDPFSLTIR